MSWILRYFSFEGDKATFTNEMKHSVDKDDSKQIFTKKLNQNHKVPKKSDAPGNVAIPVTQQFWIIGWVR